MKPKQRQQETLDRLRALQRELTVEELARTFQTSPLTIRRDLDSLALQGAILRTFGGCVLKTGLESMYQKRMASNFELKRAIGEAAVQEVKPQDVILIDDGSTTFHFAVRLGGKAPLTVYSNSLAVIPQLGRFPGIELHLLGGKYCPDMNFLGGQTTEWFLERLQFDAVFLGGDAVDEKGRCLVLDPAVAHLAQSMLKRGRKRYLLLDHTKVGAAGYVVYAALSDFDVWFTTEGMDRTRLADFKRQTEVREVRWEQRGENGEGFGRASTEIPPPVHNQSFL